MKGVMGKVGATLTEGSGGRGIQRELWVRGRTPHTIAVDGQVSSSQPTGRTWPRMALNRAQYTLTTLCKNGGFLMMTFSNMIVGFLRMNFEADDVMFHVSKS